MSVLARRPLWSRSLLTRALRTAQRSNRSARARLALVQILRRAGCEVSLVTVHAWPRHKQGEAYLWARARLEGREDLPAPTFVQEGARRR